MYCFTAFLPVYRSKFAGTVHKLPGSCTAVVPSAFISFAWPIHFFECLPLHSQLHLRILFEDLRFALTKQLPCKHQLVAIDSCDLQAAGRGFESRQVHQSFLSFVAISSTCFYSGVSLLLPVSLLPPNQKPNCSVSSEAESLFLTICSNP